MFFRLLVLFVTLCLRSDLQAESYIFKSDQADVRLISDHKSVEIGQEFHLALKFDQKNGWHIYWQNAGDSGLPATLSWAENKEVFIDKNIFWEKPDLIILDSVVNYAFNRDLVLLPVKAKVLSNSQLNNKAKISLYAEWLICKIDCIPQSANFEIEINIGQNILSPNITLFNNSFANNPKSEILKANYHLANDKIKINFENIPSNFKNPYFIFNQESISSNSIKQKFNNNEIILNKALEYTNNKENLLGTLIDLDNNLKSKNAYLVELKYNNIFDNEKNGNTSVSKNYNIFLMLFFAFLGGIILNLMPCVFPIISIKILDFLKYSKVSSGIAKRHSLFFSFGIISFVLFLAIILEIFKFFGSELGWGFQLQSPLFVSFLIIIFYLLGLSFIGFFYVNINFVNKLLKLKSNNLYLNSFLNGALATLVATPCTAPFMGTALGATLSLNSFYSLLIFLCLGLGIAFPFVALTFNQKLLSLLPKPGMWMDTLKQAMSFLMFGTCLWLLWVLDSLANSEFIFTILLSILLITFVIWLNSKIATNSLKNQKIKRFIILLLFLFSIYPVTFYNFSNNQNNYKNLSVKGNYYGIDYDIYNPDNLNKYLEQEKIVYIDFTARWCITCQVNKKRVFTNSEVQNLFKSGKVQLLVADWTNMDEQIANYLSGYGRNSVPLNVIYYNSNDYLILPTLLGPAMVLEKLLIR